MTATLAAPLPSAHAQNTSFGGSFINPFPKGDVHKLRIVGDYFASGLGWAMAETFTGKRTLTLERKPIILPAIRRRSFRAKVSELVTQLRKDGVTIVVVMTGGGDQGRMHLENGGKFAARTSLWRREYARRVDLLIKQLKQQKIAVYWVSLPVMRKRRRDEMARIVNEIVREKVYLNGIKFIDAYARFLSERGRYEDFGADLSGKRRRLRERNGETLTAAGNLKLAHFVSREITRDMQAARARRAVPLLGSPVQQRAIAPLSSRQGGAQKPGWNAAVRKGLRRDGRRAPRDQRADPGQVKIKVRAADGRQRIRTIKLARPAISASVISLMTKRASRARAQKLGDTITRDLDGGLTVMSSITPASASGVDGPKKQRLPPTHTAFYRVLIKGETLAPKVGRADDFRWPPLGASDQRSRAVAPRGGVPRG
ncbi:MAG: hypothetical protein AAFR04_07635 [Pseudomonadota bacterium]